MAKRKITYKELANIVNKFHHLTSFYHRFIVINNEFLYRHYDDEDIKITIDSNWNMNDCDLYILEALAKSNFEFYNFYDSNCWPKPELFEFFKDIEFNGQKFVKDGRFLRLENGPDVMLTPNFRITKSTRLTWPDKNELELILWKKFVCLNFEIIN
ncbi:hypothetical protein LZE18_04535 [Lactobacillus mulieris]|uniref:hypothetical protein n=1 Tax=Lactobacillus mulieris TaxID=2508708 RepID=UPI0011951AE0|nr:hypothetical protein [Lactobacillus mulieris]MCF1847330.1 hypothetical protein [Lactobacillus mulieris]TVU87247.1 hypothetical protein FOF80_04345 [Lactobacillus jensenii]